MEELMKEQTLLIEKINELNKRMIQAVHDGKPFMANAYDVSRKLRNEELRDVTAKIDAMKARELMHN